MAAASIELRSKLLAIAADAIEAAVDDLDIDDGRVFVRGTATTGMSFAELGQLAYIGHDMLPPGTTPGLEASHRYKAPPFTFSNACHICTCEVDVDTGRVTILRYVVSEDCGRMINPKVVEGQIFGGVVCRGSVACSTSTWSTTTMAIPAPAPSSTIYCQPHARCQRLRSAISSR